MYRRTARGNRIGLATVGLLLLLSGAAVVLADQGVFGRLAAETRIYPQPAVAWVAGHRWAFWVAAVLALFVVLLAVRWMLVQGRSDRVRRLSIDNEADEAPGSGRTALLVAAITAAAEDQARAIIGVRRVGADVSGAQDAPELWLSIVVDENADTALIREQLQTTVLSDVRQALERPELPVYLTLQVTKKSRTRQVA